MQTMEEIKKEFDVVRSCVLESAGKLEGRAERMMEKLREKQTDIRTKIDEIQDMIDELQEMSNHLSNVGGSSFF